MPRFFIEKPHSDIISFDEETARHISLALRMRIGDELVLCDGMGTDYDAVIESVSRGSVTARVLSSQPGISEPALKVTLFQCLPKADKLEQIVRQGVEVGASEIVPIVSRYTVPHKNAEARQKQIGRLRAISKSAAAQSGRGIIPLVAEHTSFEDMVDTLTQYDAALFFYERGGQNLGEVLAGLPDSIKTMAVIIGAEGGFHPEEAEQLENAAYVCSLGPRILRCETAPIVALGNIFCFYGA